MFPPMNLFFKERQALMTWLLAAAFGVLIAYLLGIIYYSNIGVSVNSHAYGWTRFGFGANGELATVGLIGLAYVAVRTISGIMGVRGSYR